MYDFAPENYSGYTRQLAEAVIRNTSNGFSDRDKEIFFHYGEPIADVSMKFGLSAERIRQIWTRIFHYLDYFISGEQGMSREEMYARRIAALSADIHQQKINGKFRDIIAEWAHGDSISEIANEHGLKVHTVRSTLSCALYNVESAVREIYDEKSKDGRKNRHKYKYDL